MNNKILIYPFDRKSYAYVYFEKQLINCEVKSLVAPKGWIYKDSFYKNEKCGGYRISNSFEEELNKCDTLWIVDSERELDWEKYIAPKIEYAVSKNKKILCTKVLGTTEKEYLNEIIPLKNRVILKLQEKKHYSYSSEFFDINTPVIFVCSMYQNMEKYHVQLALREKFLAKKYKILQIGSRTGSEMFGMYSYPEAIFDDNYTYKEKALYLNYFIKEKEIEEKPDVIILGIPGSSFTYSRRVLEDFSFSMELAAKVISPDYVIMTAPYYEDVNIYDMISSECTYKYGFNIDIFGICNKMIEITDSDNANHMSYISLNENDIKDKMTDDNRIFDVNGDHSYDELADTIESRLREYGTVKIM